MLALDGGHPKPSRVRLVIWVILRLAGVRWFWLRHFWSHLRSSVWTCQRMHRGQESEVLKARKLMFSPCWIKCSRIFRRANLTQTVKWLKTSQEWNHLRIIYASSVAILGIRSPTKSTVPLTITLPASGRVNLHTNRQLAANNFTHWIVYS